MKSITAKPFGIRDKLGYLFGDFGNDFTFILSSSFLLKFYTDVMHVSAGVVGIVMMLARFVDAFTDVTMGRIADKTPPTRAGKFKPWILRMCAPVAIASFLIYQSAFATAAMWFRILWLTVTYILWGSIFYTSINIPYGSMASTISREPADRQSLSTYRTMGSTLAGVVVGAGIPLVAYDTRIVGDTTVAVMNGARFTIIAGVFSALAVVAYLLCYYMTTERVVPDTLPHRESGGVRRLLGEAVRNRALISIIGASVLMLLSQFTLQQMANYVYPDYYGNAAGQSISSLVMMGGMILAAALTKPMTNKFGKAEVSAFSCILATVVCIVTWLFKPANMWVFIALQGLNWIGLGMFSMVCWAMITDVIDYSEIKNGVREDGSVYALYSFARKLGQAVAAGLAGWLLEAIGYNNNAIAQGVGQTEAVKSGIFSITTLVPALGFGLLAVVLLFWYPLHKKQVEENNAILKAKREA